MTNNQKILKSIMREHKLTRRQISDLLGVHRNTVIKWLAPESKEDFRHMPDRMIEFLKLKLESKK